MEKLMEDSNFEEKDDMHNIMCTCRRISVFNPPGIDFIGVLFPPLFLFFG